MIVLDNVIVGAFVGANSDAQAERLAMDSARTRRARRRPGLRVAGGLTTKQLRLMELARALAPRPRLLLLDETLAGLGHDELDDILPIIRQHQSRWRHHRHHRTHDAGHGEARGHFSVLDHGKLIAERPADQRVVKDPIVIEAYLGKKWMERAKDSVA